MLQVHWKPALEEGVVMQDEEMEESSGGSCCSCKCQAHVTVCPQTAATLTTISTAFSFSFVVAACEGRPRVAIATGAAPPSSVMLSRNIEPFFCG